ncbi:MAG: 16S rRNA (cytosine(1402)-N(4))-methyltransferase RsmH [Verrucomicrobiota bacterium JB022]|nr:16S rRNA (cytosine(1402)-N(4))-methyltransferase RsmH [Verrucomicrobiota bacterium JB022]
MPSHVPVLFRETLAALEVAEGGRHVLDGTFGGGGHTRGMLEAAPDNRVTAFDCDPQAAERAAELQAEFGDRLAFHPVNFDRLDAFVDGRVDGALFDLGLSSFHYDLPERGFSFRFDGPADMRLNTREGRTAAEFLEHASETELVQAIRDFGEEPRWKPVLRAILSARGTGKLQRTASLAAVVEEAAAPRYQKASRIHPATRTFQGVRIAINDELGVIERMLPQAFAALRPGGILAVISFHSLEDRIVKRFFRRVAGQPESRRDNRPQQERHVQAEILTRRPLEAGEEEIALNPRSRSAKLRVLRKL